MGNCVSCAGDKEKNKDKKDFAGMEGNTNKKAGERITNVSGLTIDK